MMTMHLVGPYLSLNGKKKGKTKFRNADQARQARELDSSWKELLKRQGVEQEERRRYNALKAPPLSGNYSLAIPEGRSTRHIPSRDTGGNATLAPAKVYTGDEMIGIGQLHKSNAIPIFKKSDAEDLAKMRR
jgi:hypothetical protein